MVTRIPQGRFGTQSSGARLPLQWLGGRHVPAAVERNSTTRPPSVTTLWQTPLTHTARQASWWTHLFPTLQETLKAVGPFPHGENVGYHITYNVLPAGLGSGAWFIAFSLLMVAQLLETEPGTRHVGGFHRLGPTSPDSGPFLAFWAAPGLQHPWKSHKIVLAGASHLVNGLAKFS